MLTPWAINKLQGLTLDYMKISCPEGDCYGWVAVHRINFALGIFHIIMGFLLLGVNSSKNPRAAIQNGFWGPKIIAWLALIVVSFLIPDAFFMVFHRRHAIPTSRFDFTSRFGPYMGGILSRAN
jgi:sterol desaturase/sphingolipid hydroxylase (fatty acid hydroxylase superfamily)